MAKVFVKNARPDKSYTLAYWDKGETHYHVIKAPSHNMALMRGKQYLKSIGLQDVVERGEYGIEIDA